MKKILSIVLIVTIVLTSCSVGNKEVLSQHLEEGFPILTEYETLAELEKVTEYEFDDFIKRSVTKYHMDSLYMQIFSAMILTNMMSEKTIERAIGIKKSNDDYIKGLSSYNRMNIEHLTYVSERVDKDEPIQEWHSLMLSYLKFLNYDVMHSLRDNYGNTIGACADISSMNVAMLRLFGVAPEDIVLLTIPEHAITSFSYKGEDYITDNAYFFKHKGNNIYDDVIGVLQDIDYGQFEDYNKVIGICNDAYYTTGFTMEGIMTQETFGNFIDRYDFKEKYQEDINYFQLEPDKEDFPLSYPHVEVEIKRNDSSKKVAHDILDQVYKLSKDTPESQYTLAKYGYQTLLVKYPEFYIRENAKTQLIKEYSRKLKNPEAMIEFVKDSINGESIFKEPHRVMDPEQVIVTERGGAKDKAVLLHALMSNNDIKAYVLFTDEKTYLLFNDGEWRILDTSSMDFADKVEGELTLILNSEEIRYPLMERDTLDKETKNVLKNLGIK